MSIEKKAYNLVELNIARFKEPIDSPINQDFIDNLDVINAIAEAQPGFIWRLKGSGNDALDINAFDDPNIALNLSVWRDPESLKKFVFGNEFHRNIVKKKQKWFSRLEFHLVLWWIPEGKIPTVEEAKRKLECLIENGPTSAAFTFSEIFKPVP